MDKSLLVFEKYVKSEVTKKVYTYWFMRFLKWTKIKDASGLLQLKDSYLQNMVEDYLLYIRSMVSPNSLNPIVASLQLFFSMNDKVMNWQRLRKMIPEKVKKSGYMAYQTEDIKKMLEGEPLRNKAIIHFLSSTGMRVGGLECLRLKNVFEMPEGCRAVLVYEGTNQEYWTFLTPEASKVFDEYLNERSKHGEYINEDSPVFRTKYQVGIEKVKMMSVKSIHLVLNRIVKKVERKKVGNRRYNFMTAHSIRKRYSTIVKSNPNIPYSVGERLLGHQAYLDSSYFRPTRENLWLEWKKIANELVIDDSDRERLARIDAEKRINELETEKDKRFSDLEKTTRELRQKIESLEQMRNESYLINSKIDQVRRVESDPSHPAFAGSFDTRLVNLEVRKINDDFMEIYDSEFEELTRVILRKGQVYCTYDRSTTCKHVLFALANRQFYDIVKKKDIVISL